MLQLFHRDFGGAGKPPLVVIHGLLGSSRNWQTVGAELSEQRHVFALDLRNHGMSPHAEDHDFSTMEADVLRWMDAQGIARAALMGHSMGGKVAMALACHHPERVERLVSVDIAPRDYDASKFKAILEAMLAIDPAKLASRAEAETQLSAVVKDWAMLKFLATNLERGDDGRFQWRVNVPALHAELDEIARTSLAPDDRYEGPTLFVIGGYSRHVREEDRPEIAARFPQSRIVTVAESGHNPHVEQRAAFVAAVREFLR
ncbi:MAG: alpha/beta fold hydrolase [Opitutaceae bacterium]